MWAQKKVSIFTHSRVMITFTYKTDEKKGDFTFNLCNVCPLDQRKKKKKGLLKNVKKSLNLSNFWQIWIPHFWWKFFSKFSQIFGWKKGFQLFFSLNFICQINDPHCSWYNKNWIIHWKKLMLPYQNKYRILNIYLLRTYLQVVTNYLLLNRLSKMKNDIQFEKDEVRDLRW